MRRQGANDRAGWVRFIPRSPGIRRCAAWPAVAARSWTWRRGWLSGRRRECSEELSAFPPVEQDLGTSWSIRDSAGRLCGRRRQSCRGELLQEAASSTCTKEPVIAGKKSVALRLSFRSGERTLSEAEVNELRAKDSESLTVVSGRRSGFSRICNAAGSAFVSACRNMYSYALPRVIVRFSEMEALLSGRRSAVRDKDRRLRSSEGGDRGRRLAPN